jgi:hypothetical protein
MTCLERGVVAELLGFKSSERLDLCVVWEGRQLCKQDASLPSFGSSMERCLDGLRVDD